MKKHLVVLIIVLVLLVSLAIAVSVVMAQAQRIAVVATFEEVVNAPASTEWRGSNLFVNDARTVIVFSGDWEGTSEGICNGVFHYRQNNPITGNLHCSLVFTGTVLGRQGTVAQTVNGTFDASTLPNWTGQVSLSHGTGELAHIAANHLAYEQTGLLGTVEGIVVFPHG